MGMQRILTAAIATGTAMTSTFLTVLVLVMPPQPSLPVKASAAPQELTAVTLAPPANSR